jgi:hypothetical protein
MNRLIRGRTLSALLGVDRSTLYRWCESGLIIPYPNLQEPHFLEQEINRMLAACPRTMPQVPTYADLYAGRLTLVRRHAAVEQLGLTDKTVRTQMRRGRLHGLQIGRYWYVTQASIDAFQRITQYNPAIVCQMIGLHYARTTRRTFNELLLDGQLQRHRYSGRSGIFVTEESMDVYLRAHLPKWVIPAIWREERLDDPRPLLTLEQIAARINRRHLPTVQQILEAERVAYIWLPGRRIRRYSPTVFDVYMELEQRPTRAEVGHWFGVHPTAIDHWRGRSLLHCSLPQHYHRPFEPFYESCWAGIMQPLLTPGLDPNTWITNRKRFRTSLMGRQLAAAKMQITPEEVTALAEAGTLKGIRTPLGEWRFSMHAITSAKVSTRHVA